MKILTKPKELDELKHGSIIACISHISNLPIAIVFQRGSNSDMGYGWCTPDAEGQIPSEAVFEFVALNGLPTKFTVLWEPKYE